MLRKLSARRPSPALIVAMIALIVALGGTGYAAVKVPAGSVGSKQLKRNAVTGAKVKNRSLTGADIKLSSLGIVPRAANASHAVSADTAANASNAAKAANATAADTAGNGFKAYAKVNPDGTVDPALSANITNANITKQWTSAYCFHGLSFSFHGAAVTLVYFGGAAADEVALFTSGDAGECGGVQNTQAEVATTKMEAHTPLPFYIVFY